MSTRVVIVIPGMRSSLSSCVHWWCTFRLRGTQPPESRRSEDPIQSLPWEETCKRVRWCCMKCTMGLGFLTLLDSIDVVRFLGVWRSQTGVLCATRMEMCSVSPSACVVSWNVGFGVKRRACHLALKPGCLAQGVSVRDTGRDGWDLRAIGWVRMFSPFTCTCWSRTVRILEITGIQTPIRGVLSGARTVCRILSGKSCALKVVLYSQFGGRGSAWYQDLHLESQNLWLHDFRITFVFFLFSSVAIPPECPKWDWLYLFSTFWIHNTVSSWRELESVQQRVESHSTSRLRPAMMSVCVLLCHSGLFK